MYLIMRDMSSVYKKLPYPMDGRTVGRSANGDVRYSGAVGLADASILVVALVGTGGVVCTG